MKRTDIRYGFRKFFQAILFLSVVISAQHVHGTAPGPDKTSGVSVTVAGTTETEILVDVKISNAEAEKLILIIENERGDELYKKEISRTDFTSRFRLEKADNISGYNLLVRTANKSLKEKYTIKTTTKLIEDITVTKL